MPSSVLLSFLLYVAVSTFTPGPNNLISMNTARVYGFRNTLKLIFGIACGFFVMILLSAVVSAGMKEYSDGYLRVMRYAGAGYILWLAWTVFKDMPSDEIPEKKAPSFLSGFVLQFLNIKSMLYGLTVVSGFILPFYHSFMSMIFFAVFLAAVSMMSTVSWGYAGGVFKKYLNRHYRVVNTVMALLLVECAFSLFTAKF